MQYVIVGAGPAGVTAAETLRQADPGGQVTLIGGEAGPPYGRMALPYYMTGKVEEAGTYLRKTDGYYDGLKIKYVQGVVKAVSPDAGALTLESGDEVEFDKLLIATGASPVKPPVPGLDLPGVHHCWTLEDARHIIKRAEKGADVVLMGTGFIGCIIMEALALRGVNLTAIELEDRMLPRMMDRGGSAMIKRWCEAKGITVLTSAKVTAVEESGGGLRVSLEKGEPLQTALVVVATGVKPNIGFLEGSGIETGEGIWVDNHLRTSAENVHAAGDVAEGPDFSTGGRAVHAIQPTAVEHGRIAALNMAGREAAYKGSLSMNVLDTVGLISCSFGQWEGVEGGETAETSDPENYRYLRLQFDGDRIVGALGLGRTDHVGVLRGLIQGRVALGPWKEKLMADPHRIMAAYVALRADP